MLRILCYSICNHPHYQKGISHRILKFSVPVKRTPSFWPNIWKYASGHDSHNQLLVTSKIGQARRYFLPFILTTFSATWFWKVWCTVLNCHFITHYNTKGLNLHNLKAFKSHFINICNEYRWISTRKRSLSWPPLTNLISKGQRWSETRNICQMTVVPSVWYF